MTVPINTPDAVPNDLIPASWGDTVRADLQRLAAQMVEKAGDSMSGMLLLPGTNPSNVNHATRKGWVDAQLSNYVRDNAPNTTQAMQGPLSAPHMFVSDNPVPTGNNVVVNRRLLNEEVGALNARINLRVNTAGDAMTGTLNMNGNTIGGLADPTSSGHATHKGYVDGRINTRLADTGGSVTGTLNMTGHHITDVGDPTSAGMAANKSYVDQERAELQTQINDLKARVTALENAD